MQTEAIHFWPIFLKLFRARPVQSFIGSDHPIGLMQAPLLFQCRSAGLVLENTNKYDTGNKGPQGRKCIMEEVDLAEVDLLGFVRQGSCMLVYV
jgi:hypothetical protein